MVVTGARGALGRSVVRLLLDQGAICHLPVRMAAGGRFGNAPPERARVLGGIDLADENAVRELYADLPGLWASIHCAGGFALSPLTATSLDGLTGLWEQNLVTSFLCSREAARAMTALKGGEGGRIVNVAAKTALEPRTGAGMAAYTAAKGAVAALTQALGEELRALGIWVNAVAPSILDTEENRRGMPDADHASWASTDDVAATIVFLASPENGSTRSAVVPVYGRS